MKKEILAIAFLFIMPALMPETSGQAGLSGGREEAGNGPWSSPRDAGRQAGPGRGQNPDQGRGYQQRPRAAHTNPNLYEAPLPIDIAGETWDREKLEGRIVLLNFWATWCAPCLDQIPEVKKIYDSYSRNDLVILGINLDSGGNRSLRRWLRLNRNHVTWPQLFNRGGFNGPLPGCYGIDNVPVLLVFNRQGELEYRCQSAACAREAVIELTTD